MTFVFTKLFNLTMKGCHKSKPGNGRQVLTDESYTLNCELSISGERHRKRIKYLRGAEDTRGERSSSPYPPGLARVFSGPRPSLESALTRNTKVITLRNHNRSMLCDEPSSIPGNYPELAKFAHTRC